MMAVVFSTFKAFFGELPVNRFRRIRQRLVLRQPFAAAAVADAAVFLLLKTGMDGLPIDDFADFDQWEAVDALMAMMG
ncbi:hypothetical protein [Neisseria yangbaofengii]|uniref:hypothetical protein n=1 Tax=Neisseria yangbaofengii TaxID=2709396 RepID=UPI0013EA32B5